MRTDQDVHLARCQVFQCLTDLCGATGSTDVVDPAGKIFESFAEGLEMLIGQHGGGYQDGNLLVVGYSLEGRTDSHLGLSEAYIATNQPIHRTIALHILLHLVGGFHLVGRIFVDKAGLQLMLHEAVWAECESFLLPAFGVEEDQVAGDVFHLCLGALLHLLPSTCAQTAQLRRLATLFPFVFRKFMERVDADKDDVVMLVDQFDRLLDLAVHLRAHQTTELTDTMVDVHDVIA